MEVERPDHLVPTVRSIETTCRLHSQVLGMGVITLGERRKALAFGSQKINLQEYGTELAPEACRLTPGCADLCFITDVPLSEVIEHLNACGATIVAGPVKPTVAMGPIVSLCLRDPDLNLIEVADYEA